MQRKPACRLKRNPKPNTRHKRKDKCQNKRNGKIKIKLKFKLTLKHRLKHHPKRKSEPPHRLELNSNPKHCHKHIPKLKQRKLIVFVPISVLNHSNLTFSY